MDRHTAELVLDFVRATSSQTVDITGGAPELNPSFRWLVEQNRVEGRHVIDRCNLTILFESDQEDLPQFLADQQVEIMPGMNGIGERGMHFRPVRSEKTALAGSKTGTMASEIRAQIRTL